MKAPKNKPIEKVKTEKCNSQVAIYIPLNPHPNPYARAPTINWAVILCSLTL